MGATTNDEATIDRLAEHYDHHSPELAVDVLFDVYRRILEQPGIPRSDAHGGFRLIAHHADLSAIGKDPKTFACGAGVVLPRPPDDPPFIPFELEGAEHTQMRQLYLDILGIRQVRDAEPYVRASVDALLGAFQHAGGGDFYEDVAARLPIDVAGELIGWDHDVRSRLRQAVDQAVEHINPDGDNAAARAELVSLMLAQIADRRERPRDDRLTALLSATIDGEPLSDERLLMFTFIFAIAGYETTARALSSLIWFLAENRALQDRLRDEPKLVPNVVEEGLRVFPSAHTFFRTVTERVELHGEVLEPGEKVALLFGAANRDPEVFDDPDTFRPDRANARQHVSFGWGAHFCAGAHLARAEMRILLEILIANYPPFELAGAARWTPNLLAGNHMGVIELPLRFVDR